MLKSKDAFRLQLKIDEKSDLNVQYVREYSEQHFPLLDFAEDEERFIAWRNAQVDQPFTLYDQPLYRILLVRCQGRLVLLLVTHHVICDNISLYNMA